jgi:hypothetical protein
VVQIAEKLSEVMEKANKWLDHSWIGQSTNVTFYVNITLSGLSAD